MKTLKLSANEQQIIVDLLNTEILARDWVKNQHPDFTAKIDKLKKLKAKVLK